MFGLMYVDLYVIAFLTTDFAEQPRTPATAELWGPFFNGFRVPGINFVAGLKMARFPCPPIANPYRAIATIPSRNALRF